LILVSQKITSDFARDSTDDTPGMQKMMQEVLQIVVFQWRREHLQDVVLTYFSTPKWISGVDDFSLKATLLEG
jgi:hypothetical protein